ncbi:MAG: ribosome recycling factor [Clostridia bacterium]
MNYANEQIELIFMEIEEKITKSVDFMNSEFSSLRAGRANPKLIEKIMVDYYGTLSPISQVSNIAVPEARMIVITPWDKSLLSKIEKAILAANVGLTPQNDGQIIRLVFPVLTEERRKDLVKTVKKLAEEAKVAIRNCRRDAMEGLKKVKNDKTVSEDSIADYEEEIDKIVAKAVDNIDKISKEKEIDVMSV